MIKLKVSYTDPKEKDKLVNELKSKFKLIKVTKEYGEENSLKRCYINLL